MAAKKKCTYCGINTEDWEIVNGGPVRCWVCGRKMRESFKATKEFVEHMENPVIRSMALTRGIPKIYNHPGAGHTLFDAQKHAQMAGYKMLLHNECVYVWVNDYNIWVKTPLTLDDFDTTK